MTSFIIDAHVGRKMDEDWTDDSRCTFCRIIANELPARRLYETDKVIAILDVLPLRAGHTLVIPKTHITRVSELPAEFAAAMGDAVSKVARALTEAMENTALNVVCNQEYAQSVPHVHYHIIPAPTFGPSMPKETESSNRKPSTSRRELHQREYEAREELDEHEGNALAVKIRARL
ncbi:HIT-like protein [Melanogaster broomeanus]|nr:HIT-like protein [Melanogaster broomeanus]